MQLFPKILGRTLLGLLATSLYITTVAADYSKAIFLFKDVMQSNTTALKTTGFNTLIIFRIGVLPSGDLVYYSTGDAGEPVDAPVMTNGEYVGGDALAEKVKSFKTGDTLVERVEVSIVSHDTSFREIRDLIAAEGTGPDSILYKHFSILKDAWDLDGFNNDDESVYDVSSTVDFALMLGGMGYKYSAAPYSNQRFWANIYGRINAASPGLADKAFVQVYDGGAGNTPQQWANALGMKIVPMEWVINDAKPYEGNTAEQCRAQFQRWFASGTLDGAGYWNDYDIEKMGSSYDDYAGVLSDIFG
ncbi:coagulation factor 5/8 type domain-containing protein [Stachybotrys elegans]|uniref:Coagulation factor 5/8 type domain-containing protein n=1 Tax=Stachybotrys elegans TaxID=80388 RepID=A0A8K0WV78_9HYPO|nr:coagulation factor 5/8 type domain-containing protein [Stachybotrys elegans]